MPESAKKPLPVVDFLKLPEGGEPYLEGTSARRVRRRLPRRAHRLLEVRHARRSSARSSSPNKGKLYVYSIVHRSFPGVEVPYVSAVVDLDGGGTVKGNLIDVEPDPEKIRFGMPVEVVYKDALGRKDKEGNSYLSYFFQPARPRIEEIDHERRLRCRHRHDQVRPLPGADGPAASARRRR